MGAINYRATIDGGAKISNGILTTVAVEILPTVRKQRNVYVRAVADPSTCVQFRLTDAGVQLAATQWGNPTESIPEWANSLRNLLII